MTSEPQNLVQLNDMFHAYSSSDLIVAQRSDEAFANEVYDVTDSNGERYFMKLLKSQLDEVVNNEAQMQKRLAEVGIGTPEYIKLSQDTYVGEKDGARFVLSKYIPGEVPKKVSLKLICEFGVVIALLHDGLDGIVVPPSSKQWLNIRRVKNDLDVYDGPLKDSLVQLVDVGEEIFEAGLPTAVIHGDLWLSNVFASNEKITTVFDLETAENTVRIIDLARTYTSLRFNSSFTASDVIEGLFEGYDKAAKTPLTPAEREHFKLAIGYVAGACATWHAIHGTRYTEPYIQLGKEALATK